MHREAHGWQHHTHSHTQRHVNKNRHKNRRSEWNGTERKRRVVLCKYLFKQQKWGEVDKTVPDRHQQVLCHCVCPVRLKCKQNYTIPNWVAIAKWYVYDVAVHATRTIPAIQQCDSNIRYYSISDKCIRQRHFQLDPSTYRSYLINWFSCTSRVVTQEVRIGTDKQIKRRVSYRMILIYNYTLTSIVLGTIYGSRLFTTYRHSAVVSCDHEKLRYKTCWCDYVAKWRESEQR